MSEQTEKIVKTRIIHKHDTAENWGKAGNFNPKAGELIIYDPDTDHPYPRFKVGNDKDSVGALPFVVDPGQVAAINHTHKILTADANSDTALFLKSGKDKTAGSFIGFLDNATGTNPLTSAAIGYLGVKCTNNTKLPVFYDNADRIILHEGNYTQYTISKSADSEQSINGSLSVGGSITVSSKATLQYDSTNECLNFVFN